jgi:hypothetical protein
MSWIRDHKLLVVACSIGTLAVLGFLAFGVFGVQTLFVDDKVDEANPFVTVAPSEPAADVGTDDPASTPTAPAEPSEEAAAPTVTTLASGRFESREHPSSGLATVITDGDRAFLRFEDDFETDNGPDLNVYLSKASITSDSGAFDDDFVDLGELKGNIGGQNYELDPSVDIGDYQSVVIWCVRFSVAFGAAPLDAA